MTAYRSKTSKLVDSLINYALDVKPYHTKLKEFISELYFNDKVTVSFIDETFDQTIYLQNVWTKNDVGSLYLSNLVEGIELDRHIPLPPAAYPRFSLNTFLDYGQTPPGDDPASLSFADANADGSPDDELPWIGPATPSHQVGITDEIPVRVKTGLPTIIALSQVVSGPGYNYTATLDVPIDTDWAGLFGLDASSLVFVINGHSSVGTMHAPGVWRVTGITGYFNGDPAFGEGLAGLTRFLKTVKVQAFITASTGCYRLPFHHGSYVTVDGVRQHFLTDYVVDVSRSFIQFLAGKHPTAGQAIKINYFNSDRLFISLLDPFNFNRGGDEEYDAGGYDTAAYDYSLDFPDAYTLVIDRSALVGYDLSFYNTELETIKAVMDEIFIYPSQNSGDTWVAKAVGFQTVLVQQLAPNGYDLVAFDEDGYDDDAPFLTGPLDYASLNQRFDNGKIAFTLRNTWLDYYFIQDNDSYIAYDVSMFNLEGYGEPLDSADFWPSLELKTEHGVVVDPVPPLHAPVEFTGIFQSTVIDGYDIEAFDITEYDAETRVNEYIRPLGVIRQVLVSTLQGMKPKYEFYLDRIPIRGTYIELRLEQARQYNPRVNVTIEDSFSFIEVGQAPSTYTQPVLGSVIVGSGILS